MEYIKKNMTSYNLHLIKTDRFKTVTVRIIFRDEIKKDEITLRNMLTSFLTYSTDTYPTKRDLVLKSEDLYAAGVWTRCYRAGRYNMINFYLTLLNEKYTEDGMFEESLKFLSDVVFHPNFNNQEKYTEALKFLYNGFVKSLDGIKENRASYSLIRMLEEMGKDIPYAYRDIGYIDDLNKITIESLKTYYNKMINNSLIDIYVIGDINDNLSDLINKYFDFKTFKRPKISQVIEHDKMPNRIKIIKEIDHSNQSKLSIGCKIDKMTEFERNYVLTIYNMILGGNSESKFFQVIREKNSLAYYVYSSLNKLDNLMLIKAGIDKSNFDKTIRLIKKLMRDVSNGNFTEEDINIAKENYISVLNEIEDNDNAIIEAYLAKDLLNLGSIEERKQEIKKVTKEDIISISKKVKIDTIFLLEGVLEDANI